MSDWKTLTPYWQFKRPTPRRGGTRPRENRKFRLDSPHDWLANPKEAQVARPGAETSILVAWSKLVAAVDHYLVPLFWGAVVALIAGMAFLVFAPFSPEVPRPEPGFPVRLLDPEWPGATTRDGRRASYVTEAPDDGRPEPPLHTHDREGHQR